MKLHVLLAGCTITGYVPATRAGSVRTADGFPVCTKARVVIIQAGTGNVAPASDNRKTGQPQSSAATAPAAQASSQSRRIGDGVPWQV